MNNEDVDLSDEGRRIITYVVVDPESLKITGFALQSDELVGKQVKAYRMNIFGFESNGHPTEDKFLLEHNHLDMLIMALTALRDGKL